MTSCKILILSVVVAVVFTASNEEQCRTYAGGNVYPDERKLGVEHALHWSKAQSMKQCPFFDQDEICSFYSVLIHLHIIRKQI